MTATTAPAPTSTPGSARSFPTGWVLAICCAAQFMVVLDISIVNVALPNMQSSLHLSNSGLAWILNAYTLAFAGFLLCGGRAADLFGRKKVFVIGLMVFTTASLLGGFAQSGGELIAARALQGLGGAVLAPSTLSLLTTTFTQPAARAKALGAWGATAASGGAFGVIAGGVLTDVADWRWVLFVNVPFGLLLIAAARIVLTESRGQVQGIKDLDLPGAVLVTAGLVTLVTAIVRTDSHSWGSGSTIGTLIGAVALLAAFVVREQMASRPLIPLDFFKRRNVTTANFIAMFLGAAMFGMFYFASLYLQYVLRYSPLKTGLAFLPSPLAIIVGAQISSRLAGKYPAKWFLMAGPFVAGLSLIWFSRVPVSGGYMEHVFGPFILMGLGMGVTMVQMTIAATSGVPIQLAGLASGLVNTGRQIGAAVGLAILETIATSRTHHVSSTGASLPKALTSGYDRGLLLAGFFLLAAVVVAATLPRPTPPPAPETPAELREEKDEAAQYSVVDAGH